MLSCLTLWDAALQAPGERVDGLAALGRRGDDVARLARVAHDDDLGAEAVEPFYADGGAPIGDHEPVRLDERLGAGLVRPVHPLRSERERPAVQAPHPLPLEPDGVGTPHQPARVEPRPLAVQQRHLRPRPGARESPASAWRPAPSTTGRAGGVRPPSVDGSPASMSSIVHAGSAS